MNKRMVICFLSAFILLSCTREKSVVESSFSDGSPKKICVYKEKGSTKELLKETTFYPGKKMQMEGTFKDNLRNGRWIYYYKNGKIWSEGFFKEGKNDGKRITYFENGRVRYEAYYKEDLRVGKWKFFDEKGHLLQVINYDAPLDTLKK